MGVVGIIRAAIINYASANRSTDNRYSIYTYEGSDDPEATDSGRSQDNVFSDNKITGGSETIKLQQADGTQFIDNVFSDVTTTRFDDVTETLMKGNTGLDDAKLKVENACFDSASDSGYEPVC